MATDSTEVLVGQEAQIYLAPGGTSLPTGMAVPSASFVDLGYTSTDGFSFSYEPTVEDIYAHQDLDPIRQIKTAQTFQITFNLMQWNEDSFALAFGGGSWTAGAQFTYSPPDTSDDIAEYAIVVDIKDGSKDARFTIKRGTVASAVETTIVNNAAAVLPITVKALKPSSGDAWNYISDELAFS